MQITINGREHEGTFILFKGCDTKWNQFRVEELGVYNNFSFILVLNGIGTSYLLEMYDNACNLFVRKDEDHLNHLRLITNRNCFAIVCMQIKL